MLEALTAYPDLMGLTPNQGKSFCGEHDQNKHLQIDYTSIWDDPRIETDTSSTSVEYATTSPSGQFIVRKFLEYFFQNKFVNS